MEDKQHERSNKRFGVRKRRYIELFRDTPPRSVYVFSERVLCAKNAEFDRMREGGGSAVAYAWFVWQKGYTGTTEVRWI